MDREEMLRRLNVGEDPLELSIEKWQDIVDGTGQNYGNQNCALCEFQIRKGNIPEGKVMNCVGCPVMEKTGKSGCNGSPYYGGNYQEELDFLKSLRKPKEKSDLEKLFEEVKKILVDAKLEANNEDIKIPIRDVWTSEVEKLMNLAIKYNAHLRLSKDEGIVLHTLGINHWNFSTETSKQTNSTIPFTEFYEDKIELKIVRDRHGHDHLQILENGQNKGYAHITKSKASNEYRINFYPGDQP